MTQRIHRVSCVTFLLLAGGALPALPQSTANNNAFFQRYLVSDIPGMAAYTDPHLVNPWAICESATSPFWISNQGSGTATVYNGSGVASAVVVSIPSGATKQALTGPTGQVQNSSTGFVLSNGKAASFIFATQDGAVSAWNGGTVATLMADNSSAGAVYTGLAINPGGPMLYAANFFSGKIDVFDTSFHAATVAGGFADPNLPSGYAPYNIWNLGGKMYVTYAPQNASKNSPAFGAGNGLVDVFDTNGNLLRRLVSNGPLNAPWGVAIAPANFGPFGGALLVGNFGDGAINAFNLTTGGSLGAIQDSRGLPIANSGLWALIFGNGKNGGDPNTLYFTAGIQGQKHGLLGAIAPLPSVWNLSNGASGLTASAIAPGEVVLVNGGTIGPSPSVAGTIPVSGGMATTLATTTVTFNGAPAPILFASASQTGVVVPYEIAGAATASVAVSYNAMATPAFPIPVAASAPGLFTLSETGSGEVVALNQDGALNGPNNPAARGSVVAFYATGDGMETPLPQDGVVEGDFIHLPMLPVTAMIGGQNAEVLFAGSAPGLLSGVLQVEVMIPNSVTAGALSVVLTIGGASNSQQNATIMVN